MYSSNQRNRVQRIIGSVVSASCIEDILSKQLIAQSGLYLKLLKGLIDRYQKKEIDELDFSWMMAEVEYRIKVKNPKNVYIPNMTILSDMAFYINDYRKTELYDFEKILKETYSAILTEEKRLEGVA